MHISKWTKSIPLLDKDFDKIACFIFPPLIFPFSGAYSTEDQVLGKRKYGVSLGGNLYTPVHQHFFVVRMDFCVDGVNNSIVEYNAEAESEGPHNPDLNAFFFKETLLATEKGGEMSHNFTYKDELFFLFWLLLFLFFYLYTSFIYFEAIYLAIHWFIHYFLLDFIYSFFISTFLEAIRDLSPETARLWKVISR